MKPKSILFLPLVILLVLLVGAEVAQNDGSAATSQRAELLESAVPMPQRAEERDVRQASFEAVWTAGGEDGGAEPLFYGPLDLEIGPAGHAFVTDYGDRRVKEISPDGALLRTYGQGRGQGPGEVQGITDILIRPHELLVADPWNQRVLAFERQGDGLRTIKPSDDFFWRLEMASPDELILLMIHTPHLFARVAMDGKTRNHFGALVEDQERHGLVLNGWLASTGPDRFVYAGYRSSLLASFGTDGTRHYLRQTIEPVPMAKVFENENERWADRSARPVSKSISVSDGRIYLLGNARDGMRRIGMTDVYDLEDGSYLHSFRIPAATYVVMVKDGFLFTADDTSITKWRFEVP
ncbi:MAG: hypothetical protein MI919_01840 [Holophagales bacterium]|nr:hypothetical protein [Holophagales bacterium]